MNGDTLSPSSGTLYSIGDLARRTGLTVKTVRYYSDLGIVSPADRNPAGHRRYGLDAVARLDLVRTLRDLGLGLPAIRQVVDAWVELAELALDDGFRGLLRRLAEEEAAEAGAGWPRPGPAAVVREVAGPAVAAGVDPASAAAAGVVEEVLDRYAGVVGGDPGAMRERLADRLAGLGDSRRERYLELLAVVNGWATPESWGPVADWLTRALRAFGVSGVFGASGSGAGGVAAGPGGW